MANHNIHIRGLSFVRNCISILAATVRAKRFDQIVPLGVNCEVAFRFYCKWGFVDSSLFAWAQVFNLRHLTGSLEHFDSLYAGDVVLEPNSMMWRCATDGMFIHGNLKAPSRGLPFPDESVIATDKVNTLARVRHLKEKFLTYARNDSSTLFVHRLNTEDERAEDLDDRLRGLERTLAALGARNWQLLVICEQPFLSRMPAGDGRIFRAVRVFNPGNSVTNRKAGDSSGWNAIFTEFGPKVRLPKKHKFKFE